MLHRDKRNPSSILESCALAVRSGRGLAWCVTHDDPLSSIDEAWNRCDDELVMREFLRDVVGIESLDIRETVCRDSHGLSCVSGECPRCARLLHDAFPSVGALAFHAQESDEK